MHIGTFLPTYWTDYGATMVAEAVRETALAAEALGYESLWANDHVIAPSSHAAMGHIVEPLTTLASLIHLVPHIHLGASTLVLPRRHPIVVAKQVAALDVHSGGRFILGVGVGWLEGEFQFLNADFARRGVVTDEAIAAMQTLWSEQAATFHGQHFDFVDAAFFPKPTAGRVPLWICGNTSAAVRRAARVGDAWDPFGPTLHKFAAGVASLRTLAGEYGRPVPTTIAAHLRLRIGAAGGPDEPHLIGSVAALIAALEGYQRAGLEYLICDFVAGDLHDLLRQMKIMAEEIAPTFRKA